MFHKLALCVPILASLLAIGCGSTTTTTSTASSSPAATTTTLSSSASSTTVGSSVTLTALVSPSSATGTVMFYNGTASLGTATLSAGTATLATSFSAAGTYSMTASYAGSSSYDASKSSALPLTVSAGKSTTNIAMVSVPGGTFFDGVANMTISTAFSISTYPITQEQYKAVMSTNPSSAGSGSTNPVDNVTWYEALVFCNTLSIAEGLTPVYTIDGSTDPSSWPALPSTGADLTWDEVSMASGANGYRLPTASEWLWAAMGGLNDSLSSDLTDGINTSGYLKGYAGSTESNGAQTNAGDYCWYSANSGGTSQPIGTKKPNELGLYDMCGNVSEWVFDYYWGEDENGAIGFPANQTDYTGLAAGSAGTDGKWRWLLGGSYADPVTSLVILSTDESFNPSVTHNFGFRVARGGAF